MPHLTPMSWIMAMLMMWMMISMMNITNWSAKPMKFTKLSENVKKSKNFWSW